MLNLDKRIKGLRESLFRYFLTKKTGLRVSDVAGFLADNAGHSTPWKTVGYETIEKFLLAQSDMIEIRRKVGEKKTFLFLRESYIPPKFKSIRKTILDQENDQSTPIYENTTEILTGQKKHSEPEPTLVKLRVPINPLLSSTFAISINDNPKKILKFINHTQIEEAIEEIKKLDETIECFQSKVSRYETLCKIKDETIEQFIEMKENLLKKC